ncbi:hypothetical protein [Chryseobacterium terrae]|uniref:Uncharacterized protein n=1 Tax=Chryseobacterium terrae TaxID=3163299 RepID=A0ABW8Y109_9FLAO
MKFFIRYFSVVILFLILILQTQMYSDFTASKSNIIILPTLIILITINVIFLYVNQKNNSTTTHIILLILVILFGINLFFNIKQSEKQVQMKLYVPHNFMLKQIGYEVKLFKDNTFEINEYWHGESRHYFGKYLLEQNKLLLLDEKIEEKTDYQITNQYQFNSKMRRFKSLEVGFQDLRQH